MTSILSTIKQENSQSQSGRRTLKILLQLMAFAFVLRLLLAIFPEVIHSDGIEYIRHAKQILLGHWTDGKSPPLYPSLIALASLLTHDFEIAGIWVSLILGTLIVFPVFYLGKVIFNEKAGILSALFASVHPSLYIYSGSVLTESVYYFLFTTSYVFAWYAFSRGEFLYVLFFGLFTALAYLTRPEAIGLLILFSVWTLFINPLVGERRLMRRIGIIAITFVVFLLFSFPYLADIRKDTGRWGISKKGTFLIGSLSGEEEVPSFGKPRGEKGLTVSSLIKHPLPVLRRMGTGLLVSLYKFTQGYNLILLFFGVSGWVFLLRRKDLYSWKANFFLLSPLIFYFAIVFPIFFISRRYSTQMIPVSIPWAAVGFLGWIEWLAGRWGKSIRWKQFSAVLLIFVLFGLFVQGRVLHHRERRVILKEAGIWMKEHLPRKAKVMSRSPQGAFYAELAWVGIPSGGYEVIVKEARLREIRYLVVDDEIENLSPGFWKELKREDWVSVKEFRKDDQRMILFELVHSR